MQKTPVIIGLILVAIFIIGFSFSANAQSSSIPSWIKNTAKWWAEGQVGDADFINGLQWLIDNNILKIGAQKGPSIFGEVPILQADEGFSDLTCIVDITDPTMVSLNGHFTNDPTKKMLMEIYLGIIGQNGNVVGTGFTALSNLEPNESRLIFVTAFLNSETQIKGCEVKIGNEIKG